MATSTPQGISIAGAAEAAPVRTFNPFREACGFYPPDYVGRLRDLGHGPKRVYERLVRYAGRNGQCYPAMATLGDDLGVSDRQVRSDIRALERARLIKSRRCGRGFANSYEFLWHPCFDRKNTSDQGPVLTGSGLPIKEMLEPPRPEEPFRSRPEENGHLTGRMLPKNSVHEFSTGKSSSTGTSPSQPTPQPTTAEHVWSAADRDALARGMRELWPYAAPPDEGLVSQVIRGATLRNLDDARAWLSDLACATNARRIEGWGFFVSKARQWRVRRAQLGRLTTPDTSPANPSSDATVEEPRVPPTNPSEPRDPKPIAASRCAACSGAGVRLVDYDRWALCTCPSARGKDLQVRQDNEVLARMRARFPGRPPHVAAAPRAGNVNAIIAASDSSRALAPLVARVVSA